MDIAKNTKIETLILKRFEDATFADIALFMEYINKNKRIQEYKELYKSKIGAYGFLSIDQLDEDNSIDDKTREKRKKAIKLFLVDEFDDVTEDKTLSTHILLHLQDKEYYARKKINGIRNGTEFIDD